MNDDQRVLTCAIGRLLRLMSRPEQPEDSAQYHMARSAALDAADRLGLGIADRRPNYAAQRHSGAQGD